MGASQGANFSYLGAFCFRLCDTLTHMGTQEAEQFNRVVGNLLRAEATFKGLSVVKLSALSGIERNTLTRYLTGERAIPLPILYRIAEVLETKPERIIIDATSRMQGE